MSQTVSDKKPIRSAADIRGAAAATVTKLSSEMQTRVKNLSEAIVGEATDRLFTLANDPSTDGPYNDKGEAKLSLQLENLVEGSKVIEWIAAGDSLSVPVSPILEQTIKKTFKDSAQLDVLDYAVFQPTKSEYDSYTRRYEQRPVPGSYTLDVKLQDPQYTSDPILSNP